MEQYIAILRMYDLTLSGLILTSLYIPYGVVSNVLVKFVVETLHF